MSTQIRTLEEAATYLEGLAVQLQNGAAMMRGAAPPRTDALARIEALAWTKAKSGKCDYCKDVSPDLVAAVRGKGQDGLDGDSYHYTAAGNEYTLFRFARRSK